MYVNDAVCMYVNDDVDGANIMLLGYFYLNCSLSLNLIFLVRHWTCKMWPSIAKNLVKQVMTIIL